MRRVLVSACLLGIPCRYDGGSCPIPSLRAMTGIVWIPACPEELGGLSTPREPAEIRGGAGDDVLDGRARVMNLSGRDVTDAFLRGAERTLAVCRELGLEEALLKARSPSCGVRTIHRGEEVVEGCGVTAALLRRHGIRMRDDEEAAPAGEG